MTQLVYLSPVPWHSFSQRPHKFVEWFRERGGGDAIWVDPYPTRLPKLSDISRVRRRDSGVQQGQLPPWLRLIRPGALPVEPLPVIGWANRILWRDLLATIESFAARDKTMLVIGKPSLLAHVLLGKNWFTDSVYDSMDHFSAFYSGVSRYVMARRECSVAANAQRLLASSTRLLEQWRAVRPDVTLVRNACDPAALPAIRSVHRFSHSRNVFGYVGTIG